MKRLMMGVVLVCAAVAGSGWFMRSEPGDDGRGRTTRGESVSSSRHPDARDPRGGGAEGGAGLSPDLEPVNDLGSELERYRALFVVRPGIRSEDETRTLVKERERVGQTLARRMGASGPGIVADALSAYHATDRSRDRLLIIDGLGQNPSEEAVAALSALYREAELFRLKEEVLKSLGDSTAPGRNDLLIEALNSAADPRLSQIAAQSLYGEAEALPALVAAVYADLPMNTRLEALHSIGGIGTSGAREALGRLETSDALEPRVRVYARHELARSFS